MYSLQMSVVQFVYKRRARRLVYAEDQSLSQGSLQTIQPIGACTTVPVDGPRRATTQSPSQLGAFAAKARLILLTIEATKSACHSITPNSLHTLLSIYFADVRRAQCMALAGQVEEQLDSL